MVPKYAFTPVVPVSPPRTLGVDREVHIQDLDVVKGVDGLLVDVDLPSSQVRDADNLRRT